MLSRRMLITGTVGAIAAAGAAVADPDPTMGPRADMIDGHLRLRVFRNGSRIAERFDSIRKGDYYRTVEDRVPNIAVEDYDAKLGFVKIRHTEKVIRDFKWWTGAEYDPNNPPELFEHGKAYNCPCAECVRYYYPDPVA